MSGLRTLAYRLPQSGKSLSTIVLSRAEAEELLREIHVLWRTPSRQRESETAMIGWRQLNWNGNRLRHGTRLSGYEIVQDKTYPTMWRVRQPNGALSDIVNLSRAKDAAMGMLVRDLNVRISAREPSPVA